MYDRRKSSVFLAIFIPSDARIVVTLVSSAAARSHCVGLVVATGGVMNAKALSLVAMVVFAASFADAKPKKAEHPSFDKAGVSAALDGVELRKCLVPNAPRGPGHVVLTIVSSGEISEAKVDQGPFVGTPVERCISNQFKKLKVPTFTGAAITLGKSFAFGS